MQRVAFIGLGNIGYPLAGHLQRAGYAVTVYNRTPSKAQRWQAEYGGTVASTPRAAAAQAEIVLTCVGNDDDLRQVVLGNEGIAAGLQPGSVLIDHSTVSAALSRQLAAQLATQQAEFVDAPVSGGQQGAINGQLSIMCGAEPALFARVEPLLRVYGKAVVLMGPTGSGQLTKMVNQICVAGLLQGLAEGMYFAEQAGLDVAKAMQVISQGAASSWQMQNRYQTMLAGQYDHGFAVDWMHKDLGICLAEAAGNGARLPVTTLVRDFYAEVQAAGGGRWDTSSLLKRLQTEKPHAKKTE